MTEDLLFSGPVQTVPFSFKSFATSGPAGVDWESAAELHVYSWLLPSLSPPKTVQEYRVFWLAGQERVSVHLCKQSHIMATDAAKEKLRWCGNMSNLSVGSRSVVRGCQALQTTLTCQSCQVRDNDSLQDCRSSVIFIFVSTPKKHLWLLLFVLFFIDIFLVFDLSFCYLILL